MRAFFNEQTLRARVEKHRARRALVEALKPVLKKLDSVDGLTESERAKLYLIRESEDHGV